MGSIAATAFFLTSPFAAVNEPSTIPPEIDGPPAHLTIAAARLPASPVALLPRGASRASLAELVTAVVKRQLDEEADDRSLSLGPSPAAAPPVEADAAVVAAHEQRIAILKSRLADLRTEPQGSTLRSGLRQRLRRAEAARALAWKRSEFHRLAELAAARSSPTVAAAAPSPGPGIAMDPPALAVAGGALTTASPAPPSSTGLALAHRSLRIARALLESTSGHQPETDRGNAVALAGLLRWSGSDRWSLADLPGSVT